MGLTQRLSAANQKGRADGARLAKIMFERFEDELQSTIRTTIDHCERALQTGIVVGGTSSMEDCLLLYLLIRHFDRKHVFEIGTYIGTTAVCMNDAVRKNGGKCTTSDPINYGFLPPWSGIRFIQGASHLALQILEQEAHPIDFCFMDWMPDAETLDIAKRLFRGDTIIGVHDYLPGDKGEEIVARLNETYCTHRDGIWFLPINTPWRMEGATPVNQCTAFFIPTSLV